MNSLHESQPVLRAGTPLEQAQAALVMVHGRGASARDILSLTNELDTTGFACLAPQAAGNTWYPYRFMEPVAKNEPYLTSALKTIDGVLRMLDEAGLSRRNVIVLGFSQGACLASEYVARHAGRYGGVVVLSGGLIGDGPTLREYDGSLDGTPVFLGCSDVDPHIPLQRVEESAALLRGLGGEVDTRIYPNMDHTVNRDELGFVQQMMNRLLEAQRAE